LNGSISWADVQKKLEQVRSVSWKQCIHAENQLGKQLIACGKAYVKDPGLLRGDFEVSSSAVFGGKPGTTVTLISKLEPGRIDRLLLDSGSQKAELETRLFNTDERREPPSQLVINIALNAWVTMAKIAEDKTKIIGDRVIDGIPAVGFNFDISKKDINIPDNAPDIKEIFGQLWVNRNDGTPLLTEARIQINQGLELHYAYKDIQWNAPLEESLFNLDVPEGWHLNKKQIEAIDYEDNKLAPGITLSIYTIDQESMITAEDVVGIVQAVETSYPGSNRPNEVKMTIELSHEAAQHLHDYADIHPDNYIRVNFNEQLNATVELDRKHTNRVSFDLSWLDVSLSEIEERYFTTSTARNE
jgi:hypothetical protein